MMLHNTVERQGMRTEQGAATKIRKLHLNHSVTILDVRGDYDFSRGWCGLKERRPMRFSQALLLHKTGGNGKREMGKGKSKQKSGVASMFLCVCYAGTSFLTR
jgi:hypothetical protein